MFAAIVHIQLAFSPNLPFKIAARDATLDLAKGISSMPLHRQASPIVQLLPGLLS